MDPERGRDPVHGVQRFIAHIRFRNSKVVGAKQSSAGLRGRYGCILAEYMRDELLDPLQRVPTPFGAMFPLKFDRALPGAVYGS